MAMDPPPDGGPVRDAAGSSEATPGAGRADGGEAAAGAPTDPRTVAERTDGEALKPTQPSGGANEPGEAAASRKAG
ncbi:hypothetical protein THAOC_31947, partial [Thalassiosira oceanica]